MTHTLSGGLPAREEPAPGKFQGGMNHAFQISKNAGNRESLERIMSQTRNLQ
jgi:hypothetical protein